MHGDSTPPLPPTSTFPSPRWESSVNEMMVQPTLSRDESAGEVSNVTDPSLETAHRRTISWDANVKTTEKDAKDLLQPVLNKNADSPPKHVLDKAITVADLHDANPLESEAETSLMRAIEQRAEEEKHRGNTTGNRLFAHIPDEGFDVLQADSQDSQETKHSRESPKTPRLKRFKPKRDDSLETTLFGLANAMKEMHGKDKHATSKVPDHHLFESPPLDDDEPTSNADAMVRHAAFLFQSPLRKKLQEKNGDSEEHAPLNTSSHSHRSRLSVASGNSNKQSGNNPLEGVPEEMEYSSEESDPELGGSDIENSSDEEKSPSSKKTGKHPGLFKRMGKDLRRVARKTKSDWAAFSDFIQPRKASVGTRIKIALLFVVIPTFCLSAVLFHLFDNPDLGREGASISWFVLFILRQTICGGFALASQSFIISFLTLRTRWTVRVFGPLVTLVLVQSKGYPFIMMAWAVFDLALLSGRHAFAKHWLFWQDLFPMLNASNPAGTITESRMNFMILICALGLGFAVTMKRIWLGTHFGKRTYLNYGDQLAAVMQKILLISEVASFAKEISMTGAKSARQLKNSETLESLHFDAHGVTHGDGEDSTPSGDASLGSASTRTSSNPKLLDSGKRDALTGSLSGSQKVRIIQLLENWEEPELASKKPCNPSINAVLQFRQALTFTDNVYPFSLAFGLANNRESCIMSSQKVYERLLRCDPDKPAINFRDTIALLAVDEDGDIEPHKMKDLIQLFRPDRDGHLSMIDFIRSVDSAYKQLRMLKASIANSGQIDHAFEVIFNWAFFIVAACIILSVLGFNPLALFLSLSSIILGFAFMIGGASAKYFEGILFILVRRPYDIGDRIHVSPIDSDTSMHGSPTWFVENVDLFTTTIRFGTTNEVASVANGSLASSRIINGARSPRMLAFVFLKFGIDVPYQKVQLFKKTMEEFAKQRPRDWLAFCGFRATRVEQEQGFIEYLMVLQHRESWQNIVPMLDAKAEITSFALEVSKKMGMRYHAPALPVDLTVGRRDADRDDESESLAHLEEMMKSPTGGMPDVSKIASLFADSMGK